MEYIEAAVALEVAVAMANRMERGRVEVAVVVVPGHGTATTEVFHFIPPLQPFSQCHLSTATNHP